MDNQRLMIDLTKIYDKLNTKVNEDLFRSTVRVLIEQHYIKEGLIKNE